MATDCNDAIMPLDITIAHCLSAQPIEQNGETAPDSQMLLANVGTWSTYHDKMTADT